MITFILSLLLGLSAQANTPTDIQNIEAKIVNGQFGFRNLVTNPSCRRNAGLGITATSVSMTANTTSSPLDGISDCTWNPTATAQIVSWAMDSMPSGWKGQNCEARVNYRGDASLVSMFVRSASGNIASGISLVNADQNSAVASINYPCGDGTAYSVVLQSTGDAASVQYSAYAGLATNLSNVSQSSLWGAVNTATTTNCSWSTGAAAAFTSFGADADCPTPTTTGNALAPTTKIPAIRFTNLPPGEYLFIASGNLRSGSSATNSANFQFNDGSTGFGGYIAGVTPSASANAIYSGPLVARKTYTSTQSDITIQLQARDVNGTSGGIVDAQNGSPFEILVYRFPSSSQLALTANTTPAFWSGYHDTTCSWSRTNTAIGDFTADASCAATTISANNSNISCTTTGGVLPAIACTFPKPGTYQVCANVNAFTGSSDVVASLSLTDGSTVLQQSLFQNATGYIPPKLCGLARVTGLSGTYTIQGASASGSLSITGASPVRSAIEWFVFDVSQQENAPLLVGSVTSNSTGAERIERASLTCSSSSSVNFESGDWISTIGNVSSGSCVVTLQSGIFSSANFNCAILPQGAATTGILGLQIGSKTSTSLTITGAVISSGSSTISAANTGYSFDLICQGPR